MTGPAHYTEAERCLSEAEAATPGSDAERFALAVAQIHATLAVCAAQALSIATSGLYPQPDCDNWTEAVTA